jgi:hypothetical protein
MFWRLETAAEQVSGSTAQVCNQSFEKSFSQALIFKVLQNMESFEGNL